MSPSVPAHCPFAIGDRVTFHGYPGRPEQPGFTGTVEDHYGATILGGTTDDGNPWTQTWGSLYPVDHDIAAATDGYRCTCHYRPWPQRADGVFVVVQHDHDPGGIHGPAYVEPAQQLDLFGAIS